MNEGNFENVGDDVKKLEGVEGEDTFMDRIMKTDIPEVEVIHEEKDPVPTEAELKELENALKKKIPNVELRDDDHRETL